MRIPIVALCAGLVLPVGAARAVSLTVVADEVAIVRETPTGAERMVTLTVTNPEAEPLSGMLLRWEADGARGERSLLEAPSGESHDTLWLAEPVPARLSATLTREGATLWQGELDVPPAAAEARIPLSEPVRLAQLRPLMLRGTNYYPRSHPWPGLWRDMNPERFEAEFVELDGLGVNCLRTFCNFDAERGLHYADGAFTATLLSRMNDLLTACERHRMKLVLCIGSAGSMSDLAMQRRYFRTCVEPFRHDGRIVMWDLINEPGGSEGPKTSPELSRWLVEMWAELLRLDPEHIATVGLCWQFDQLLELGIEPPLGQYHHYSGSVGIQPEGEPPVRNASDDLVGISKVIGNRPLLIGEFGYSSVPDAARPDASEERKRDITRWVLEGGEDAVRRGVNLVGVMNWCAFRFEPDWMGPGEQAFGVIRLDGSLEPAGEVLRDTYARWRALVPAPWEG